MAEALGLLAFLLLAGLAYVVLRQTMGPARYVEIVMAISMGTLGLMVSVGLTVLVLPPARSGPIGASTMLLITVFACSALYCLWLLWFSAYALWYLRRPLVEVDSHGVRLWALAYRHVPWAKISAVAERHDGDWTVFFMPGHTERLAFLPLRTVLVRIGWARERAEIAAAADLIRKHPNYRERDATA